MSNPSEDHWLQGKVHLAVVAAAEGAGAFRCLDQYRCSCKHSDGEDHHRTSRLFPEQTILQVLAAAGVPVFPIDVPQS